MVTHITRWVLVVAVLLSLGGHWQALQIYAWARMVQKAAPEKGLGAAVVEAVSGEAPCSLCNSLRHVQKRQDPRDEAPALKQDLSKADKVLGGKLTFVSSPHPNRLRVFLNPDRKLRSPVQDVPDPPPRWS